MGLVPILLFQNADEYIYSRSTLAFVVLWLRCRVMGVLKLACIALHYLESHAGL